MRQGNLSQIILILLGLIATLLLAFFTYHEFFPEYKIFQKDFVALQNFNSE